MKKIIPIFGNAFGSRISGGVCICGSDPGSDAARVVNRLNDAAFEVQRFDEEDEQIAEITFEVDTYEQRREMYERLYVALAAEGVEFVTGEGL